MPFTVIPSFVFDQEFESRGMYGWMDVTKAPNLSCLLKHFYYIYHLTRLIYEALVAFRISKTK